MGVFAKGPRQEEEPGSGGSGLHVDLDLQVCPTCHRELHPWEAACPDDGTPGAPKASVSRTTLPPPPAHLLGDADDDVDE